MLSLENNKEYMIDYKTFFPKLVVEISEFQNTYKEHLHEYGELLPHVLMGDFTRFLIDTYHKSMNNPAKRQIVIRGFHFLEKAFVNTPDPKVRDLILVSFLENLDQAEDEYNNIKALLGPILQKEL